MSFEYRSGLERIMAYSKSGGPVKDLSRIRSLLSALGDPQDDLVFVHVAGTNGKGSVCEMFSEVFQAAGMKTGLFTSPFIMDYTDRIRVNGQNIPMDRVSELSDRVLDITESLPEKDHFSQFEVTLGVALLYFKEEKCDMVVLETGIGGMLDATNAVHNKILTVITSVSLDHTALLGKTLGEIAYQKAGIMLPEVPCITCGSQPPEVSRTLQDLCRKEVSAQLWFTDPARTLSLESSFAGEWFKYKGELYHVPMGGRHQLQNAALVIDGCRLLGIDTDTIALGLSRARVPGRAEVISQDPLIILDGAHNPDAMQKLMAHIQANRAPKQPLLVVLGMCKDKEVPDTVAALGTFPHAVMTVDGFSPRAESAEELAKLVHIPYVDPAPFHGDPMDIYRVIKNTDPDGVNLITGSLYLASWIKNGLK